MSVKTGKKTEKEECDEEEKEPEDEVEWEIWTNPLEELSEIEDAFETDGKDKLHGKSILDVGTDCVKPLYIALKFEPSKIVGINEDFSIYPFESDLKQKSKFFTQTEIRFCDCSLFNDEKLKRTLGKGKFDFILVSKTLHHLRTGECRLNHEHRDDEKCCVYRFEEQKVFERLFRYGSAHARVIVYEAFYPDKRDIDKVRGRGGYFTGKEWKRIFRYLLGNYRVEFIEPIRCCLDEKNFENVIAKLREVDYICFFVERAR